MADEAAPPRALSTAEFRRNGHAMIEFIADYYDRLNEVPGAFRRPSGEPEVAPPCSP